MVGDVYSLLLVNLSRLSLFFLNSKAKLLIQFEPLSIMRVLLSHKLPTASRAHFGDHKGSEVWLP